MPNYTISQAQYEGTYECTKDEAIEKFCTMYPQADRENITIKEI